MPMRAVAPAVGVTYKLVGGMSRSRCARNRHLPSVDMRLGYPAPLESRIVMLSDGTGLTFHLPGSPHLDPFSSFSARLVAADGQLYKENVSHRNGCEALLLRWGGH